MDINWSSDDPSKRSRYSAASLVDEEKSAGRYEVRWDASGSSRGVYFYRMQTGDPSQGSGQWFVETRKMVVVKQSSKLVFVIRAI